MYICSLSLTLSLSLSLSHTHKHTNTHSLAALHAIVSIIGIFLVDVAAECRRAPKIVFYSGNFPIFFPPIRACVA